MAILELLAAGVIYAGAGGAIPDNCHPFCDDGGASTEHFISTISIADDFIITGTTITVDWTHTQPSDFMSFGVSAPSNWYESLLCEPACEPAPVETSRFNGQSTEGDWTLNIFDGWYLDSGYVTSWHLEFDIVEAKAVDASAYGLLALGLIGLWRARRAT